MKEGFTLVELSIALVIIGLLIAGVLVGQSLVETAKINNMVSKLRQYEILATQFRLKFKSYPGDSPMFVPPGNGNGHLEWGPGVGDCSAIYPLLSNYEPSQFWSHLSQSGMMRKTYLPFSPTTACGGDQSDSWNDESLAEISWPIFNELNSSTAAYMGYRKGYLEIGKAADGNLFFIVYTNPKDAPALENKMGVANWVGAQQTGLAAAYGVGNCPDNFGSPVLCTDDTAMHGQFYYLVGQ